MNRQERRAQKQKQAAEARKLQQQLRRQSLSPDALLKAGDRFLQLRKWNDAIDSYQQVLAAEDQLNPESLSLAHERIAYALSNIGKVRQALSALQRAIALTPERSGPHKNIAALYNNLHKTELALPHLERASQTLKDDPDLHYLTAECHRRLKDRKAAIAEYAKAINLYGSQNQDAHRLIKLGRSLAYCGQTAPARDCFKTAITLRPDIPGGYMELSALLERDGEIQPAITACRKALSLMPQHPTSLSRLAGLMAQQGRLSKAAWAYRRLQHLFPGDHATAHLLAAVSEKKTPEIADEDYVRDLFDDYADRFDDHLVNGLGYQTPQLLQQLLADHLPDTPQWNMLDLGCGTGLCGPLIKPAAKKLTGIDLSQGMLDKAAARDVYDRLTLCDALAALEDEYHSLDLCLSADVFVYIGDLSAIFAACVHALRSGGLFAFSVEKTDHEGFHLDITGRYQHSDSYIHDLAQQYNFTILRQNEDILRYENKKPVAGTLYLMTPANNDLSHPAA
ncbi:MAG: hypothetical protein CMF31_01860 [Kordiimonas sp.]|nr:hypothetical protein [Kordiimonas sp.]